MRPLEGMRVVDLSHAITGPFCAYHLGLLGADVIKVERPGGGDEVRTVKRGGFPDMSAPFIAINAGKRSIALDLKNSQGREVLYRLVEGADILVENFRPGVTEAMGIGWEQVRSKNPRLIYCSISGFGRTGELRNWAAYDGVIQAMSGMMSVNGLAPDEPLLVGFPIADFFTGFAAHAAVVAAVAQRARGGPKAPGQYVDVSMLDSMLTLMSVTSVLELMGAEAFQRPSVNGFSGWGSPTAQPYQTRDGYIYLSGSSGTTVGKIFSVLGVPELIEDPRFADERSRVQNREALYATLAELFKETSADEMEAALSAVQVPVSKIRTLAEALAHPQVTEREVLHTTRLSGHCETARVVGTSFRFEHDGPKPPESVPAVGEHSDQILLELGYSKPDIANLREAGAL
jgi:crotonobetainyl-CoA:carnitine CoA-transferase CaiB-like acyl-CoA transferase